MILAFVMTLQPAHAAEVQGQPREQAPIASRPIVEIEGKVARVGFGQGGGQQPDRQGSGGCLLIVESEDNKRWKVRLGPVRFLMEQDFSPEAGDAVKVKGFRLANGEQEGEIVAITVSLLKKKQQLRLRSEDGFPVWRGGPHRGRRR